MTTTAVLSPSPVQKFFDNNGAPLAGGLVYTYAGGTSTPVATYTDSSGATTNPNPITLNARGEAKIWLTPNVTYKFNVTDSSGNTLPGYPVDNISWAQLLSLYGGVDTGVANGYILSFASPYSGYSNGMLIYWIPGANNTGASTINVNGFGPVNITNPSGSALGANQIIAGQITEIIYYQTGFQLISVANFTGVTIGTFGTETVINSASTTDLGSATAHVVSVSGTTTITSFGTSASLSAPIYVVRFAAALTLTHNATSLILPWAGNIVTSAGDSLLAEYLGSGNWKVLLYQSDYVQSGSFTATLTGMSVATTGTMYYRVNGNPTAGYIATLYVTAAITGTYSSGSVTITGLPAAVTPAVARAVNTIIENNNTVATPAQGSISNAGVISFLFLNAGVYNGVIGSGVCGLTADWNITYPL